jgi:hypothetical protein
VAAIDPGYAAENETKFADAIALGRPVDNAYGSLSLLDPASATVGDDRIGDGWRLAHWAKARASNVKPN